MIDSFTKETIRVRDDGDAGPYIMVQLAPRPWALFCDSCGVAHFEHLAKWPPSV